MAYACLRLCWTCLKDRIHIRTFWDMSKNVYRYVLCDFNYNITHFMYDFLTRRNLPSMPYGYHDMRWTCLKDRIHVQIFTNMLLHLSWCVICDFIDNITHLLRDFITRLNLPSIPYGYLEMCWTCLNAHIYVQVLLDMF